MEEEECMFEGVFINSGWPLPPQKQLVPKHVS